MNVKLRFSTPLLIGLMWFFYTLFLIIVKRQYLFIDEYIEILIAVSIQILIYTMMKALFSKKYIESIVLSSIVYCVIVILWHYSIFSNIISTSIIFGLFLISTIVSIAILYIRNKDFRNSNLKQAAIVIISSVFNILGAIFTFYVVHYWI